MEYESTVTFRLSKGSKIFYYLPALVFTIFGIIIWNHGGNSKITVPAALAIGGCFLLISLLALANLRRKLVITKNVVSYIGLFTSSELPLKAIKGRRFPSKAIVLEPVSAQYQRIVIRNYFDFTDNAVLLQWATNYFTDLDAADLEAAQQQLLQNESLGAVKEKRQQLLQQAKTVVPVYNTTATITAFLCIIIRGQVSTILMLLLPMAGVFLLFTHRGLIKTFSVLNRSVYPSIMYGLLFSSIFPLIPALFQYNIPGWSHLLLPAFSVALLMAWLLNRKGINPAAGERRGQIVLIAIISLAYGFGSTRLVNCDFDNGSPTAYPAVVQERIGSSKAYVLVLAPWGPQHSSAQVEVSRLLYRLTQAGDTVTVKMKPGLLQASWYWVEAGEDNLIQEKEAN